MEEAPPGDDVADFVLIVRMLDVELREHGIQPGGIGIDVDYIRCDVATLVLELLDLVAVGAQDLIRGSIRREVGRRLPAFVVNANPGEIISHLVVFTERTVFIGDSQDSHGIISRLRQRGNHVLCAAPERTSTSIRNSRISTWRLASCKPVPQV